MQLLRLWPVVFSALLASAAFPTRTVTKRQSAASQFVTTDGGSFVVNGSAIQFVGTNAYWLPTLNNDDDIDNVLGNMSANGVKVVRTWAFNDVETIPESGTWFQLIANGTATINTGPNGLQKLDTVIRLAEKHNMFVLLSLTNNWNPRPLLNNTTSTNTSGISVRDVTPGTNNSLPRNTLSNDFGGMDVYVRGFANSSMHDEFYTNPTILAAFMNYTTQIVSRYVNNTSVFSWEVANDPRCNSSLPASPVCNTTTITQFHSTIATHIKSVDPNHLVSSGNQGFLCADCLKLFPRFTPPPPQVSPVANSKRRSARPMTKRRILAERRSALKKAREFERRNASPVSGGLRIRGRWTPPETKRQEPEDQGVGSAFDGSSGVDSEDILNIPNIGFGTFQLFPDQDNYGFVPDPSLPSFNNTVNAGLDWINRHAEIGTLFNKPVTLTGFGLVTQSNAPAFVPFNSSVAPFGPDSANTTATQPFGVTDQQRDDAYAQWLAAGFAAGLQGMVQYQWTAANLTTVEGTNISPTVTGTGLSPDVTGPGFSPNDGYSLQGVGDSKDQAVGVIQQAAQSIAPDSP